MRLYRLLLLIFPADFRRRFGDDMSAVFGDRLRAARQGGPIAVARLWARTIPDITTEGIMERRAAGRHQPLLRQAETMLSSIVQDVRHGLRVLRCQPGLTALAVFTLALGIGASTAIVSVFDAAMLRALPYPAPEQIMRLSVEIRRPDGSLRTPTPSMDDLRRWQSADDVVSHVAGVSRVGGARVLDGPEPERVTAVHITADYLSLYGKAPLLGREFNHADTEPGAPAVVILGYGYWQSRYGGDPDVIGRTLVYDGAPATIVGVLPESFQRDSKLWRPLRIDPADHSRRGSGRFYVVARLRAGVDPETVARRLSEVIAAPIDPAGQPLPTSVQLRSELESATGRSRTTVIVLASAVGLILLIACVNVAGLLLARGTTRQAELAVRTALGAWRGRLLQQLLTESLLLALLGAGLGVVLAWLTLDMLVANIPMSLPTDAPAEISRRVLLAALGLTVATGVLFGFVPAMRTSRAGQTAVLAYAARGQRTPLSRLAGQTLIAIEVALALVLAASAGLMLRSFARVGAVDLGFDAADLLTMETQPVQVADQPEFYAALLERLRSMPAVAAAGAIDYFPLSGSGRFSSARTEGHEGGVGFYSTLPGFFETLQVPVVEGRSLTLKDAKATPAGVLVNEVFVKEFFPDGHAIGRRIDIGRNTLRVVGVVADMRRGGPFGETEPEIYSAFDGADARPDGLLVVVRPAGTTRGLADQLRQAARSVGPGVVIERIRTGDDWFDDRVITPRRRTVLLSLLGALGVLLALVGIFGMTAYAVARRTREIGIRIAFGARPDQVVQTMLRDAAWPVAIGLGAGLAAAAFATQVIASFLFQTEPTDVPTFALAAAVLAGTALLAAWVPSRRATRVDPVEALRVD